MANVGDNGSDNGTSGAPSRTATRKHCPGALCYRARWRGHSRSR